MRSLFLAAIVALAGAVAVAPFGSGGRRHSGAFAEAQSRGASPYTRPASDPQLPADTNGAPAKVDRDVPPEPPPLDQSVPLDLKLPKPKWELIAAETFDGGAPRKTRFRTGGKSTKCVIENGEARIQGVMDGGKWAGAYCSLPVSGDTGHKVEISGDFRLVDSEGRVTVGLTASTDNPKAGRLPLYVAYSAYAGRSYYRAHTRQLELPVTPALTRSYLRAFGDEAETFHTLRIIYDRQRSEIAYYADKKVIGRTRVTGELGALKHLRLQVSSSTKGAKFDVRIDNIHVRAWGDRFLEKLVALKDVTWKRRDPVEEHLVWYFDSEGLALADIREKRTNRFRNVMDIPHLRVTGIVFGSLKVWVGTPQGLLAWDRKRRFWHRVAVGAQFIEANVDRLWQADSILYVLVRDEDGKSRTFAFDPEASSWRSW